MEYARNFLKSAAHITEPLLSEQTTWQSEQVERVITSLHQQLLQESPGLWKNALKKDDPKRFVDAIRTQQPGVLVKLKQALGAMGLSTFKETYSAEKILPIFQALMKHDINQVELPQWVRKLHGIYTGSPSVMDDALLQRAAEKLATKLNESAAFMAAYDVAASPRKDYAEVGPAQKVEWALTGNWRRLLFDSLQRVAEEYPLAPKYSPSGESKK